MAIKFEKIQAGMTLYDRRRQKMGNTTLSTISEWSVRVLEKREDGAMVSWNGNRPEFYHKRSIEALSEWSMRNKDEAEVVRGIWDSVVKVTRRKKCATCKRRHASVECPPKETP